MVLASGLVSPDLVAVLRSRSADMAAQLSDLVAHESPSDEPVLLAACAARVAELGTALLGRTPERMEVDGRVHLVWRFGTVTDVVLVGHYDTVWPAGTLDRWPFEVDGSGRATGPGVFDMKGGIVQLFHALSVLPLSELSDHGLAVVLTGDEELGSQTSRRLVEDTTRGARAALVLEPSAAGALKVARKGTSMYRVHAIGRSAHAGLEPEKGLNATVELAHQVLAIDGMGRPEVGTTVTPTVISGGTTTNTVPATAVLHVDGRAEDPAEQQRVDAAMRTLTPVLAGCGLRIEGGINRPPMPASSSAGLMALAGEVAARLGLEPLAGVAVGGGSDGNFTAALGVPTLDGLGADGDRAHAEGEYIKLDSMPERAALVAAMVVRLLDPD